MIISQNIQSPYQVKTVTTYFGEKKTKKTAMKKIKQEPVTDLSHVRLVSGRANPDLAEKISNELGIPLTDRKAFDHVDDETSVKIAKEIQNCDVYIIQPTSRSADGKRSQNDHLMELIFMISAAKRNGARSVTCVIPYFAYSRQDRDKPGEDIQAETVTRMLREAGMDNVITVDLHAKQTKGFLGGAGRYIDLSMIPMFLEKLVELTGKKLNLIDIVSPDAGGIKRIEEAIDRGPGAYIHKQRDDNNQAKAVKLIGKVTKDIAAVIDDMYATAGTISNACLILLGLSPKKRGGNKKKLKTATIATHPILAGKAIKTLKEAPMTHIITSDTIEIGKKAKGLKNLHVVSCAPLIADAIREMNTTYPAGSIKLDA